MNTPFLHTTLLTCLFIFTSASLSGPHHSLFTLLASVSYKRILTGSALALAGGNTVYEKLYLNNPHTPSAKNDPLLHGAAVVGAGHGVHAADRLYLGYRRLHPITFIPCSLTAKKIAVAAVGSLFGGVSGTSLLEALRTLLPIPDPKKCSETP